MRSKRKKNVINLITRISVVGIAAITAALIILLSAFNGIESMIESLYSEFDTDLTIRPAIGKTFNEGQFDKKWLKTEGVNTYSFGIEETVVLKKDKKWTNAQLYAVDNKYLEITDMENHIINGEAKLQNKGVDLGIIGATLLDKLDGYIPENIGYERVVLYVPKNDIKIRPGKNPFRAKVLDLSGRINYNKEVNEQAIIVPLKLGQELLDAEDRLSAVYIDVKDEFASSDVKEDIQQKVGDQFIVKTNYEKNELIYKTSKSERIIVLIILLFIFVLAAFNLVASLTMLFVEKSDDVKTMQSFGASKSMLFKIFFFEGLLISAKGIIIGMLLGYLVSWLQIQFNLIEMPNSGGVAFPVVISWKDGVLIFSLVAILSTLFSYFPVRYLIRKNVPEV